MRNLLNFALFQLVWFVAVEGAAEGALWIGPLAAGGFLVLHLGMVQPGGERGRELAYVLAVAAAGSLADSVLAALGVTRYPTSAAWGLPVVPPWIASLWLAFGMLPRYSLGWLAGRPRLAALLGAVGGPLSYYAGTRLGSVAPGEPAWLTWGALALEYALVTPLLLRFATVERPAARSAAPAPGAG